MPSSSSPLDDQELVRRCDAAARNDRETWTRLREQIDGERKDTAPRVLLKMARNNGMESPGEPGSHFFNASTRAAVSPDGMRIYTVFQSLCCWEAGTLKPVWRNDDAIDASGENAYARFLLLTPDDRFLLFGVGYQNRVWVADAATGQVLRTLEGHRKGSVTAAARCCAEQRESRGTPH